MMMTNELLRLKIEEMEKNYDEQFVVVFDAIKQILREEEKPMRPIGF